MHILRGTIASITREKAEYTRKGHAETSEYMKFFVTPGKMSICEPFLFTAFNNSPAFGLFESIVPKETTLNQIQLAKAIDDDFLKRATELYGECTKEDVLTLFTKNASSKNTEDRVLGFAFSEVPIDQNDTNAQYYVFDKNGKHITNNNGTNVKTSAQRVCILCEWQPLEEEWAVQGAETFEDALRANIRRQLDTGRLKPVNKPAAKTEAQDSSETEKSSEPEEEL